MGIGKAIGNVLHQYRTKGRRKRALLVTCALFVLVLLAVEFWWMPIRIRYLAYKVRSAETAEEEEEAAFALVNMLTGPVHSYGVRCFDAEEQPIPLVGDVPYHKIQYVEIEWQSGYTVRRRLTVKGNIDGLLYE